MIESVLTGKIISRLTVNPDILTCGNLPQLNMTTKPTIPYYPDWKLEKALEKNLLLYRMFEKKIKK